MSQSISADFSTLMRQAPGTIATYLVEAIDSIDSNFGEGFAKRNPALVGAFIQACAADFNYGVLAQQIRLGLEEIAGNVLPPGNENIADALEKIADNLPCVDSSLAEAVNRVGDKLDRVAYGLTAGYDGDPADSMPGALRSAARIIAGKEDE
jgi:hypothetical protein